MLQTVGKLITTRRNFLIRASAITAAGATVSVPIVTVADARTRAEHHLHELHKAFQDMYPGTTFTVRHRFPEGLETLPEVMHSRQWPLALLIADGPS
jgi:hypothetical protein